MTLATPSDFEQTFREVIRVGFNWERFFAEGWPVELITLNVQEELSRCFMPWYIGPDGSEVAYDDPGAVPMNLLDVPKAMALLNHERRLGIQQYVDSFRDSKDVIEFAAPTYSLPNQQHFILDRNHRLSALTVHPVRFKVTLWNVCGPLESECLLDLNHWTSKLDGTTKDHHG